MGAANSLAGVFGNSVFQAFGPLGGAQIVQIQSGTGKVYPIYWRRIPLPIGENIDGLTNRHAMQILDMPPPGAIASTLENAELGDMSGWRLYRAQIYYTRHLAVENQDSTVQFNLEAGEGYGAPFKYDDGNTVTWTSWDDERSTWNFGPRALDQWGGQFAIKYFDGTLIGGLLTRNRDYVAYGTIKADITWQCGILQQPGCYVDLFRVFEVIDPSYMQKV